MRIRYCLFLLFCFALSLNGQPVPPPATQTEVNAGINRYKYVTPATLSGWTGTNAAALVAGSSVYVAASGGSDSNAGTEASPLATLDGAVARLHGIGTITMLPGVYRQNMNATNISNIVVIARQPMTNDLGTNISSGFTSDGAGLFHFTYITNSWVPIACDAVSCPAIYEMGTVQGFIRREDRHPDHHQSNYRMRDFYRLVVAPSLAGVTNGSYFVSNNVIFLRLSDGGTPSATRPICLPSRWSTNSFVYNGTVNTRLQLYGVNTRFGYNGFNASFMADFRAYDCSGNGSYASGFENDAMFGPSLLQNCEFNANSADGASYFAVAGNTNFAHAYEKHCRMLYNMDEGSSGHYAAYVKVDGGIYEYQDCPVSSLQGFAGAAFTPSSGSMYELDGVNMQYNDAAIVPVGDPSLASPTMTNTYTKVIGRVCSLLQNRVGVWIQTGQIYPWVELISCTKKNASDIAWAIHSGATGPVAISDNCTYDDATWVFDSFAASHGPPMFRGLNTIGTNDFIKTVGRFATRAGGTVSSNAQVGGVLMFSLNSFTNHSTVGSFTNFARYTNEAHLFTNNGDGARYTWGGLWQTGTNQLAVAVGNRTNAMDSGVVTNLGLKAWRVIAQLMRSGNTSIHLEGRMIWDAGGGVPFNSTNFNLEITETNGIPIAVYLQGQAIRSGGITNNFFQVESLPAGR